MALRPVRGLSFCSGIGGIELGLIRCLGRQYTTVCYVEGEAYAAAALVSRMQDGSICEAPVWSDVATFDSAAWRGRVDIITAGYPCQPFSQAGKRAGENDPRHLWPHIARHIAAIRPRYVFCENVTGHLSLGFDQVCRDLEKMGYGVAAGVFSAEELGAAHRRERLFFLAYAHSTSLRDQHWWSGGACGSSACKLADYGKQRHVADTRSARCVQRECGPCGPGFGEGGLPQSLRRSAYVADTDGDGQLQSQGPIEAQRRWLGYSHVFSREWAALTDVGRVVSHGIPHRVDRLRALGNSVVPACAEKAWRTLSQKCL